MGDPSRGAVGSPGEERLSSEALLAQIRREMDVEAGGQIVHVQDIPARQAEYGRLDASLPSALQSALEGQGITQLYSHQVEAIERARLGENLVVVTATSSGKTLCYNLPVLETILHDREARALYLYPINALVNDQLKSLMRLDLSLGKAAVGIAKYTGGLSSDRRRAAREREPQIVLTNPEMLHLSFLLWHEKWESLWRNLRYVVVDEVHTYRGVFGANMAHLFRRLRRMAAHYGADPQFICCSATMANPKELAETLTGLEFGVVDHDGAGSGRKYFVLWNPPLAGEAESNLRRSYAQESVDLMLACMRANYNTIVFARARRLTESMLRLGRDQAGEGDLPDRIASYRAGYLAEEREEIENRLKAGEVQGVITTNALEMGIDIGGLDAAVISGYPGTVMSTWQQAGRAGRRGRDALVFLVGSQNPLDQYYLSHPRSFFSQPHELAVVDLENPHVRLKHLLCAARELPFTLAEVAAMPAEDRDLLEELLRRELLERAPLESGDEALAYPKSRLDIHFKLSLRSAGQSTYRILDENRKEVGTIEPPNVFREAHPGAIYQHGGDDYRVTFLDQRSRVVRVRPESALHYTRSSSGSSIRIERVYSSRPLSGAASPFVVSVGDVLVEETIYGYRELQLGTDTMVKRVNLDTPLSIRLHTTATWLTLDPALAQRLREEAAGRVGQAAAPESAGADGDVTDGDMPVAEDAEVGDPLEAGLHAVQHLLTGVMPLLVMCDRRDVDGFYHTAHPDLAGPAVFLYDAYEGGIGLAEVAYGRAEALLRLAHDTVASCRCHSGCPSCIQSGSCRLHNERLDKAMAAAILAAARSPEAAVGTEMLGRSTAAEDLAIQGAADGESLNHERALEELLESTRRRGLVRRLAAKSSDEPDTPEPETPAGPQYAPGDRVEMSPYGRGTVVSVRQAGGREWVTVRWQHRGRIKEVNAGGLHKIN